METNLKVPNVLIVHAGIFHADDVCTYAFLKLINPDIGVIRTNKVSDEQLQMQERGDCIVADISGGMFDHHTPESMEYRNSEKKTNQYAAFGKTVRHFWPLVFNTEREYNMFDKNFVLPVDYADCNGSLWHGVHNYLSDAISAFNAQWDEESNDEDRLERFLTVGNLMVPFIQRAIQKTKSIAASESIVEEALMEIEEGNHILKLRKYLNYAGMCAQHPEKEICFAEFPALRGGWNLHAPVYNGENMMIFDKDLREDMLQDKECTFVHPAGFIAAFKTEDAADRWAEKINILIEKNTEIKEKFANLMKSEAET